MTIMDCIIFSQAFVSICDRKAKVLSMIKYKMTFAI